MTTSEHWLMCALDSHSESDESLSQRLRVSEVTNAELLQRIIETSKVSQFAIRTELRFFSAAPAREQGQRADGREQPAESAVIRSPGDRKEAARANRERRRRWWRQRV